MGSILSVRLQHSVDPFPSPFPGVWQSSHVSSPSSVRFGIKKGKSGGSTPFYRIEKGAATTLRNDLFIVVPVEKVVAVAAVLPNSVVGG